MIYGRSEDVVVLMIAVMLANMMATDEIPEEFSTQYLFVGKYLKRQSRSNV